MGLGKNSGKQASLWHSLIGLMDEVGTLFSSRGKGLFSVGEQHSLIARFSQGCSGLLILSTFCEIVNDSLKFGFLEVLLVCFEEAGIFLLVFQRLLFFFLCSSAFPNNTAWCFRKSFTRNVTISLTPPSFSGVQVTEMVIFSLGCSSQRFGDALKPWPAARSSDSSTCRGSACGLCRTRDRVRDVPTRTSPNRGRERRRSG